MTQETLEVTYPGPACSDEAIAAAERVEVGAFVCFLPRLEIGLVRGDQHIPRSAAEQLIASGTVKRTNPPPKAKATAVPASTFAPKPAQE